MRAAREAALVLLRLLPVRSGIRVRRAVAALRGRDEVPFERRPPALAIPPLAGGVGEGEAGVAGHRTAVPTLVTALGWEHGELAQLSDALLARAARVPLRVLVVTDVDAFAPLRRAGLLFEYIPPPEDWNRLRGVGDYEVFLAERIDELVGAYRAERVVALTAPADVERLPDGLLTRVESTEVTAWDPAERRSP